ncbi:MAG: DUF2312 domain-containing protein [Candidatus Liberibacter europaeus]|uniref:DUF2312 domain-containing protein n=1 Tax=Candidatus Liberibacter europaeus TaxID=744859 RepID=A0A2T4VWH7_9HYPH|nr:DUF2312 domain-containing protein [Candidatus Liberibacter europaeus]PTL86138.1 MAG: DUF2312 domain-containing protein [Candidatus Liberibacter europaeus]
MNSILDNTQDLSEVLRSLVDRIESLEKDKKTVSENISYVYAEAKAKGFDVKAIKKVLLLRKKDEQERMEEEQIIEIYLRALGMIKDE